MPIEAAVLIADDLLENEPDPVKGAMAAAATLTSYDLLSRPSELMALKPKDITLPQGKKYPDLAVVIASQDDGDTAASRGGLTARPAPRSPSGAPPPILPPSALLSIAAAGLRRYQRCSATMPAFCTDDTARSERVPDKRSARAERLMRILVARKLQTLTSLSSASIFVLRALNAS